MGSCDGREPSPGGAAQSEPVVPSLRDRKHRKSGPLTFNSSRNSLWDKLLVGQTFLSYQLLYGVFSNGDVASEDECTSVKPEDV